MYLKQINKDQKAKTKNNASKEKLSTERELKKKKKEDFDPKEFSLSPSLATGCLLSPKHLVKPFLY